MKKYIGTKQISATPAWRINGKVYPKDGNVPRSMNREDGYKVVYEDGYESWSPKDVFEKAYKIAETPVDRMQIESDDLVVRFARLAAFIDSGKMDETVEDEYNKCLMEIQCRAMFEYLQLLEVRIQRMQGLNLTHLPRMSFGMAIQALKFGFPVRRIGWRQVGASKGWFVIKQVPAHIEAEVIPKMQSLSQPAKNLILKGTGHIDYTNQCLIYNEDTGKANSWAPSADDIFAEDWEIVI